MESPHRRDQARRFLDRGLLLIEYPAPVETAQAVA
jgi:hypothetical protein